LKRAHSPSDENVTKKIKTSDPSLDAVEQSPVSEMFAQLPLTVPKTSQRREPELSEQTQKVQARLMQLRSWEVNANAELQHLRGSQSVLKFHSKFVGPFQPLPLPICVANQRVLSPPPQAMEKPNLRAIPTTLEDMERRRAELTKLIKQFQQDSGKKLDKGDEPPRVKCHWDYLLDEMKWMATDFERERKWKQLKAKKLSRAVQAYHARRGSNSGRGARGEIALRMKLANSVAREIKKFWLQIQKLADHLYNDQVQKHNAKVMNTRLESLVDQTEKMTKSVAKNIMAPQKLSGSRVEDSDEDYVQPEEQTDDLTSFKEAASQENADDDAEELSALQAEAERPISEILKELKGRGMVVSEEQDEEESESEESDQEPSVSSPKSSLLVLPTSSDAIATESIDLETTNAGTFSSRQQTPANKRAIRSSAAVSVSAARAAVKNDKPTLDEEDEDYNQPESEDDDETTLEAEEKLEESSGVAHDDELEALQAESELPLDELLAQYGYKGSDDSESDDENDDTDEVSGQGEMDAFSAQAKKIAPSGFDYSSVQTQNLVKLPHLLRGQLREYQHIGLNWLVSMYHNKLNGILADEMGLGKTIQTISLLAYLACDKGIWGQHLIVVPTSVIVNWELEFKRFLPGVKVLSYHGSGKERKAKRRGWADPNTFHVCITSYQLVLQDHNVFRRKKWQYLILDEAHNIKNFRSQRWQTLLNFRTEHRLLLTGTPLQNNMMELWSLMHFLMPQVFESQKEFKEWFSNPVTGMVEGKTSHNEKIIERLHGILRPFLLRRLKTNVATQLPSKIVHDPIICRLSKRQRQLYEEFMAASSTQECLKSGNYLSMMNVLMQLRKVCNHPDIFAGRTIVSPFMQLEPLVYSGPSLIFQSIRYDRIPSLYSNQYQGVDLHLWGLMLTVHENRSSWEAEHLKSLQPSFESVENLLRSSFEQERRSSESSSTLPLVSQELERFWPERNEEVAQLKGWMESERFSHFATLSNLRLGVKPIYGSDLISLVSLDAHPVSAVHQLFANPKLYYDSSDVPVRTQRKSKWCTSRNFNEGISSALLEMVKLPEHRAADMDIIFKTFVCIIPSARAPTPVIYCAHPDPSDSARESFQRDSLALALSSKDACYRVPSIRQQIYFPDKRLLQWDCGKLQVLAELLRKLHSHNHRVLIFTQMTKMLDILESFLNTHGHTYLRLDGATKVLDRQRLMERFNTNPKIFCFILSTRSGGIGVNLTGADTVIFYDSDWNPAMDQQAQDRCHRIGQLREVNIYRLISKDTIEENILRKSNQKRDMNDMVIGDGQFSTDFFAKLDPRELLGTSGKELQIAMSNAEDESDRVAAQRMQDEIGADAADFQEVSNTPQSSIHQEVEMHLSPVERLALRSRLAEYEWNSAYIQSPAASLSSRVPSQAKSIPTSISPYVVSTSIHGAVTNDGSPSSRPYQANSSRIKLADQKNFQAGNRTFKLVTKFSPDLMYLDNKMDGDTPAEYKISESLRTRLSLLQSQGWIPDDHMYALTAPGIDVDHQSEDSDVDQQTGWFNLFTTPTAISRMLGRRRDRAYEGREKSGKLTFIDDYKIIRIPKWRLKKIALGQFSNREAAKRFHDSQLQTNRVVRGAWQTGGRWNGNRERPQKPLRNLGLFSNTQSTPTPKAQREEAQSKAARVIWTPDEDNKLLNLVKDVSGSPNWRLVSDILNNTPSVQWRMRSFKDCKNRYFILEQGRSNATPIVYPNDPDRKGRKKQKEPVKPVVPPKPETTCPVGLGSDKIFEALSGYTQQIKYKYQESRKSLKLWISAEELEKSKSQNHVSHNSHSAALQQARLSWGSAHVETVWPRDFVERGEARKKQFQLDEQQRNQNSWSMAQNQVNGQAGVQYQMNIDVHGQRAGQRYPQNIQQQQLLFQQSFQNGARVVAGTPQHSIQYAQQYPGYQHQYAQQNLQYSQAQGQPSLHDSQGYSAQQQGTFPAQFSQPQTSYVQQQQQQLAQFQQFVNHVLQNKPQLQQPIAAIIQKWPDNREEQFNQIRLLWVQSEHSSLPTPQQMHPQTANQETDEGQGDDDDEEQEEDDDADGVAQISSYSNEP